MQQKAFTLQNKGMNRDLSISKAGESSAYENHNIRITATDHDTLLSVTNERGTKEIDLNSTIDGTLIGWNVLNKHIILFTHEDPNVDRIYRVDYDGENFRVVYGAADYDSNSIGTNTLVLDEPIFQGDLGFSVKNPIESVVYFETEDIQKIYWVDGLHVLRFMNFMVDKSEVERWENDETAFDSDKFADYNVSVSISKDQSGNSRPNGVAQYLLTFYNKHGQQSGYIWISDLVYLTPKESGGSADGQNTSKITLEFNVDEDVKFTSYRIYSIFRSSLNGEAVGYIVADGKIEETNRVVDDYSHLTAIDVTQLLYLGSQEAIAGTLAHKDQTLFLGGITSTGQDYSGIETVIRECNMFDPETGMTSHRAYGHGVEFDIVSFVYDDNIDYSAGSSVYIHDFQLGSTSSEILSFKGGEKYRFALRFKTKNGVYTPSFWIGDAVNNLYPMMDESEGKISRVVARCVIPDEIRQYMEDNDLVSVQLMVAEATYADRSIKAQGILSPTLFNTWERYNDRLYSFPSWITRPRGMSNAYSHFNPINNATSSTGEVQCNYWTSAGGHPTPYYYWASDSQSGIIEKVDMSDVGVPMDGISDWDHLMLLYRVTAYNNWLGSERGVFVWVVKGTAHTQNGITLLDSFSFTAHQSEFTSGEESGEYWWKYEDPNNNFTIDVVGKGWFDNGKRHAGVYGSMQQYLIEDIGIPSTYIVDKDTFARWKEIVLDISGSNGYFNPQFGDTLLYAANSGELFSIADGMYRSDHSAHTTADRWISKSDVPGGGDDYMSSFYKKHLIFIDENVVTLNSPEIEYGVTSLDNTEHYKLRVIGAARVSGIYADYAIEASNGKLAGENLIRTDFSSSVGDGEMDILSTWPLWREYGLAKKSGQEDIEDISKRTRSYYEWGPSIVNYWLYMWHRGGVIPAFTGEDDVDYSRLNSKVFANMKYSNYTKYFTAYSNYEYDTESIRLYNYTSSQYANLTVNGKKKSYDGNPDVSLSMPGSHKYPVSYSSIQMQPGEEITPSGAYLFSNEPIEIKFASTPHAVIGLKSWDDHVEEGGIEWPVFKQSILPKRQGETSSSFERATYGTTSVTGAILPWIENNTHTAGYPFVDYLLDERYIPSSQFGNITYGEPYVLIGEIYYDYSAEGAVDNRYGGISDFAVRNCRFIPAGETMHVVDLETVRNPVSQSEIVGYRLYGTRGDTYFQRWDCLKTKPYGLDPLNGVIDLTSVILETHINIDGQTNKQRGTRLIASINPEQWGDINTVYSQTDNFFVSRDLDDDANEDRYNSSITWTLDKADSADIDEWTHITLANTLKLDGDKGACRAIRRFQNSLIAFQDRAISEILFNSRTQIATTDGVPIEIANSGKVDGKRYISNKYGCTNKWSIVEGKAALYFVDNINKAFCAFNGNINALSTEKGFNAWFRRRNNTEPWTPDLFNNFVSFYDRVNSDVYLVGKEDEEGRPTLVYNEILGEFTSFYDYDSVPIMANVEDRFVSFKNNKLWLQNEGLYCNFFGSQYDYWIQYRVTPNPYTDKIWSGIDYRADFYRVLDEDGTNLYPESEMIRGDYFDDNEGVYQENTTFDNLEITNEYQKANIDFGKDYYSQDPARKKFRIWRLTIPRAQATESNKYGLDRIRNPWINLTFKKKLSESNDADANKDLMQLHDMVVRYFE